MSVLPHARSEFSMLRVSPLQAGLHRLRALRREFSDVSINASALGDLMFCITFLSSRQYSNRIVFEIAKLGTCSHTRSWIGM